MLRLFTRLFTGYPQAKRPLDHDEQLWADVLDLRKRLQRLEIALQEQSEALSTTQSQLHKLRGQVHGPRGQLKSVNTIDSIPVGDKEALRAAVGLRAGKAFTHEE